MIWLLDSRSHAAGIPRDPALKGPDEIRQEVSQMKRVDWSHGYQGGKPMLPNFEVPRMEDKSVSVELTPVLLPKIGVSTQTYIFWAEWPDKPQNPREIGWEIAPDEVTTPLCGVGMVRTEAMADSGSPSPNARDGCTQTAMHWEWHPCAWFDASQGGEGFWHGPVGGGKPSPPPEGTENAGIEQPKVEPPAKVGDQGSPTGQVDGLRPRGSESSD